MIIADDHARVRSQIRATLETGGCEICGEGATADEAVQLALEHRPDVALLDIHMPGNGIYAAARISRELPEAAIIMLTQSNDDDDLFDALRAGASGYLLKNSDPASLPDALRRVLAGEAAMSASLIPRILQEFRGPNRRQGNRSSAAAKLSPREWEVMELLGQGNSTDQVAKRLFVSSTTVRVHVSSVLRKLAVTDRHAAFRLLRDD
ncbi:MAG: response regulator transcription factor [Rhodanobacter sp.]